MYMSIRIVRLRIGLQVQAPARCSDARLVPDRDPRRCAGMPGWAGAICPIDGSTTVRQPSRRIFAPAGVFAFGTT